MANEKIRAALASVVESIREMGPERFRAEIDARAAGGLALALAEIEQFASNYLPTGVIVSSALIEAIHWGVTVQDKFGPIQFDEWIAANDTCYALAA